MVLKDRLVSRLWNAGGKNIPMSLRLRDVDDMKELYSCFCRPDNLRQIRTGHLCLLAIGRSILQR